MPKTVTPKVYKIEICNTVTLYLSNDGFRFLQAAEKFDKTMLLPWEDWKYYWQPYKRDDIIGKIKTFLESFPDWAKCHKFYQSLSFKD